MGAGGTDGGSGRYFLGLIMLVAGGYLFLDAVEVTNFMGFGRGMMIGNVNVPGGLMLLPMSLGFGIIFYNSRNPIGWIVAGASIVVMVIGIISSANLYLRRISLFEMIIILALIAGGAGLFLSSLRQRRGNW